MTTSPPYRLILTIHGNISGLWQGCQSQGHVNGMVTASGAETLTLQGYWFSSRQSQPLIEPRVLIRQPSEVRTNVSK